MKITVKIKQRWVLKAYCVSPALRSLQSLFSNANLPPSVVSFLRGSLQRKKASPEAEPLARQCMTNRDPRGAVKAMHPHPAPRLGQQERAVPPSELPVKVAAFPLRRHSSPASPPSSLPRGLPTMESGYKATKYKS